LQVAYIVLAPINSYSIQLSDQPLAVPFAALTDAAYGRTLSDASMLYFADVFL